LCSENATKAFDLNLIAFRRPTHIYRSDSCPAGLGGCSHKGFAWRFYLPDNLQFHASNNLLEHLAVIITLWIDIIAGRLTKGNCALSMTNSTTSEGWLKKSNFIEDGEDPIQATIRIKVAQHTTSRMKLENAASGSVEPITTLPTPSPGTRTQQTMNSPKSSAHTAPLSFHSTSKLFYCRTRSSHG